MRSKGWVNESCNQKKEKQVHASRKICASDPFRTLRASDDHYLPHEPFEGPLRTAAGYIVVPFQEGIASIGGYLYDRAEEMGRLQDALEENERLQEEIDSLTMENAQLQQERYELENLRSFMRSTEKRLIMRKRARG